MLPEALTVRNYRSFGAAQRLELRPITLLFGQNNAGKSALIRAFPLLADSAASSSLDALELGGRLRELQLDFESLRWKGRAPTDDTIVEFVLHWPDEALRTARFGVWEHEGWRRLVVEELSVQGGSGEANLRAHYTPEARGSRIIPYRDGHGTTHELAFRGLKPLMSGGSDGGLLAERLEQLSMRLEWFASQVLWLRSLRPAPSRELHRSEGPGWMLAPSGSNASIVMANEPEVLAGVSAWYEQHVGYQLSIDESSRSTIRTRLLNKVRTAFDIDLIDTGEGLSQLLPVITALVMAEALDERRPAILAIEEPEAHLHLDLQRALAEKVCEVAARGRTRIVLETHSRYFMLAMQRAILRGELNPSDVILYWVHQTEDRRSIAEPVTLDELGRVRGAWPSMAFEDDLDLLAEIQDLRDARESP